MDISMPEFDGLFGAREIRSLPEFKTTPMIAVTSYGHFYREEAFAAGYDDVLDKRRFFEDMFEVVSKFLPVR
jgi:CheY-like chemotaxis protein